MRASWDEYFGAMAALVATRATCPRLSVGCVLVRDRRVISTGYNGSLPGSPHCDEVGCLMVNDHCERTIHAEANAILFAARAGISTEGATAYVTHEPCSNCRKMLITAGVTDIAFANKRPDRVTSPRS